VTWYAINHKIFVAVVLRIKDFKTATGAFLLPTKLFSSRLIIIYILSKTFSGEVHLTQ